MTIEARDLVGIVISNDSPHRGNIFIVERYSLHPDDTLKWCELSTLPTFYIFKSKVKLFERKRPFRDIIDSNLNLISTWIEYNPDKPLRELVDRYKTLFSEDL